jgi:hypothetical protein
MFEEVSFPFAAPVTDPAAAWARAGLEDPDGLDVVAAGDDPLADGWGPGLLTAADAPDPRSRAAFTITYGTGLEDPGVLDALLAVSRGSTRPGTARSGEGLSDLRCN